MATVHALCVVAQQEEVCTVCLAPKLQDCACDRPGVHLCRVAAATRDGFIPMRDMSMVMYRLGVFAGWTLVPDPPEVA